MNRKKRFHFRILLVREALFLVCGLFFAIAAASLRAAETRKGGAYPARPIRDEQYTIMEQYKHFLK